MRKNCPVARWKFLKKCTAYRTSSGTKLGGRIQEELKRIDASPRPFDNLRAPFRIKTCSLFTIHNRSVGRPVEGARDHPLVFYRFLSFFIVVDKKKIVIIITVVVTSWKQRYNNYKIKIIIILYVRLLSDESHIGQFHIVPLTIIGTVSISANVIDVMPFMIRFVDGLGDRFKTTVQDIRQERWRPTAPAILMGYSDVWRTRTENRLLNCN